MTASVVGEWDVTIKTPVGSLHVVYDFRPVVDVDGVERDGAVTGTAAGKGETVPLTDVVVEDGRVRWRQTVTKPMRLKLEFDVEVVGDRLTGHSRAGRLPRSAVAGVRRVRP
ncbi:hypothetical protein MARA_32930 [Mycolicibacterium arabiense]|uniref:Polyketide cyclase n=1 Tax=Mycolicibacterium arabiense TaxID=1286181 RepID=A0A7I7S1J3_9MYCO|nr:MULTISPECIES: hypothetical protein [Mycobacteriaceae]MCV7371135.1 hypothetical protein [Mycolicibacterium arabiense]BBY49825.1 hypothetical protein MARA_32930 [Mycolicibacterium arabiense]